MHHQTRGRRSGGGGRGMGSGYRGHQQRGGSNRNSGILDHPPTASSSGGSGTMRSEHLQLRELDLELALLKRKRELIEQQQSLLNESSFSRGNQYNFNEARGSLRQGQGQYNEPRSGPARQPGHYYEYERPRSPVHRAPAKRPADSWPQSAPKRFSAPRGRRGRPAPAPPAARPGPSGPQPKTNNFNPSGKVTKPNRPAPTPNKMNSYPVKERKNLVSQASHLTKEPDEYVLLENVPPSRKLVGRLELALGYYLKELRGAHETGPYEAVFRAPLKLRSLKQTIRERIRTAMLGKAVGTAVSVMTCVRDKYHEKSDEEMLKIAQATEPLGAKLAILPVEEVDPEKYLKQNFNMLLGRKLTDIFDKIQKLYYDDPEIRKSTQETIDTLYLEMNEKMGQALDQLVTNGEEALKTADCSVTNGKESAETGNEAKPEDAGEAETVVAPTEKVDIPIEPIENPLQAGEETKEGDVKPTTVDDDVKPTDSDVKPTDGDVKPTDGDVKPTDGGDGAYNAGYRLDPMDRPAAFYNKLVDVLLKRRLPQVLPKFKDNLIKILNSDLSYTDTKAYLIRQANKKAEAMNAPQKIVKVSETKETPKEPNAPRFFQFFVKIMGRPNLPKRKNMQAFLDQFHPASIKKHRGIHNLLFIALTSKQDYDNLMAANNTVIGNSVLDIRIGGKGKGEPHAGQDKSGTGGAGETSQNMDFTDDNLITNESAAQATTDDKSAADYNAAADNTTLDEDMPEVLNESLDTNGGASGKDDVKEDASQEDGSQNEAAADDDQPAEGDDDEQIVNQGQEAPVIEIGAK